jgi:hypothetical protein
MAGQRRGERRGHGARGGAGARRLGLALPLCLILLACSSDPQGPGSFVPGGNTGAGSSTGGGAEALIGSWRNVAVIQVPGDLQTWTTTWRFDAEGTCRQTSETESLAEGFPRTTERACSYATSGDRITISYLGGGSVTYDFSFADFSPDRLVLDGFEYERLA